MTKYLLVAVAALVAMIAGIWWTTQQQPTFYRQALKTPFEELQQSGDQFEENIIRLANDMKHEGRWQVVLSQDQINGWIASDLPEKFPDALPRSITDPRVSISEESVQVAFRFESGKISGIVHIKGEIFCTTKENQLAFRIQDVRTGLISIPLESWTDRIQQSLARRDIALSWVETDGDPVALIDLPERVTRGLDDEENKQCISVESIETTEGQLRLVGMTTPLVEE